MHRTLEKCTVRWKNAPYAGNRKMSKRLSEVQSPDNFFSKAFLRGPETEIHPTLVTRALEKIISTNFSLYFLVLDIYKTQKCPNSNFLDQSLPKENLKGTVPPYDIGNIFEILKGLISLTCSNNMNHLKHSQKHTDVIHGISVRDLKNVQNCTEREKMHGTRENARIVLSL
jgi:hypothetical protein